MSGYVLWVELDVAPKTREEFMTAALANAAAARSTEPGCLGFDVLVDPENPCAVRFYEVYVDEAAFDAHRQTAHFKVYAEAAARLLEGRRRIIYRRMAP